MRKRGSGILLHMTSLPSAFGIGDMGTWAFRFVDFLADTRQSFWQVLPLNPTDPYHCNSPYQSASAFAGSPLLISPELLVQTGLLQESDLEPLPEFRQDKVDYQEVLAYKERLFQQAYESFREKAEHREYYEDFCEQNHHWLDDFALFMALKSRFHGQVWSKWPERIRDRQSEVLQEVRRDLVNVYDKVRFLQYAFFQQWLSLKKYCNDKGIQLIGDIPIYVHHDSADVWANPDLFKLDEKKEPTMVAGVPPDYFSETGQLWGNPVYRWDVLQETGYEWWIRRIACNLTLFDLVRVDHFRGFVGYWEVPSTAKTAIHGSWIKAPARDFFGQLVTRFPALPVIAEDLGIITPEVREVMEEFGFPGMKVLLFAFGEDLPKNPYIPHNLVKHCVAYTGTHDNNTAVGWLEKEATAPEKNRLLQYLGRNESDDELHWQLVRLVMMSVANTVIFPMQDLLGLGEEARMNKPASTKGNWEWRLSPDLLTPGLLSRLLEMTELYGRT